MKALPIQQLYSYMGTIYNKSITTPFSSVFDNEYNSANAIPSSDTSSISVSGKTIYLVKDGLSISENSHATNYSQNIIDETYNLQEAFKELVRPENIVKAMQENHNILENRIEAAQKKITENINNRVKEIVKNSAIPKSIFDNREVPEEIKEYLFDKPVTAVRYQRLYEQSPKKAQLFIENIIANGDYTDYDMDAKYKGWEYGDVLKHINALLEVNYQDVSEGNYENINYLNRVFTIDDGIGTNYSSIWKKEYKEGELKQFAGNYEYTPISNNSIYNYWTLANSEQEYIEDAELNKQGLVKIRLHKPIGVEMNKDYNMIIDTNIHKSSFFGGSPDPKYRSLAPYISNFYGSVF